MIPNKNNIQLGKYDKIMRKGEVQGRFEYERGYEQNENLFQSEVNILLQQSIQAKLMTESALDLQLNINLGKHKYVLSIPSHASLQELVHNFLAQNHLSHKYYDSIVAMATQHLKGSNQPAIPPENIQESQSSKNNSKVSMKMGGEQLSVNNGQSQNNESVKNIKNSMLFKIQQELQSKESCQAPESRKVYELWKQKQKQKNDNKSTIKSNATAQAFSKKENHPPDFFYNKGLNFKKECDQYAQSQFKKHYPFQLHPRSISQDDKAILFNRLSNKKNTQNTKIFLQRRCLQQKCILQNKKVQDPIKTRLKIEDEKVDREVFKLLKEGNLKGRKTSKSPLKMQR